MKELNNGIFELTDEELAKVVGGVTYGTCPDNCTVCTWSNCADHKACSYLKSRGGRYYCNNGIPGNFFI